MRLGHHRFACRIIDRLLRGHEHKCAHGHQKSGGEVLAGWYLFPFFSITSSHSKRVLSPEYLSIPLPCSVELAESSTLVNQKAMPKIAREYCGDTIWHCPLPS